MAVSVLHNVNTISFPILNEVNESRQKYEREYAKFHTETFNSMASRLFKKLACLANESSNSISVASEKFQESDGLILRFMDEYKEVYKSEFSHSLKRLSNSFKAYQMASEAFVMIAIANNTKDEVLKYTKYIRAYQLLGDLAKSYWFNLALSIRRYLEDFVCNLQDKLEVKAEDYRTNLKLWPALNRQPKLFQSIVKDEKIDLFIAYESTFKYCISSTLESVNQDKALKLIRENQEALNLAVEETIEMMEMGVDISDPLVITPLGWMANKYLEIAEYCNQLLTELVEKQITGPVLEIEDRTVTGEF